MLSFFEDLVSEPGDTGAFAEHIGMHLSTDDEGLSWWPVFLFRYASGWQIDEKRVARDLATFPPIARRVAELRMPNQWPASWRDLPDGA